ncbi:MAG: SIS domain-containing protein [Chloroflexi bacterium]|nr:SIS domain-containing protein [Chloroflexota bacterium]
MVDELKESARLQEWLAEHLAPDIARAAEALVDAYRRGGKVLLCGNGGSAAESQHLAAELMGRFRRERRPLAAVALTTDTSVLTALGNDFGFEEVFLRQVEALVQPGDVLVALSTSGRSQNVNRAVRRAGELGATSIGLLGGSGGELAGLVDIPLLVPSDVSARVQECHLTISHILCALVEEQVT